MRSPRGLVVVGVEPHGVLGFAVGRHMQVPLGLPDVRVPARLVEAADVPDARRYCSDACESYAAAERDRLRKRAVRAQR